MDRTADLFLAAFDQRGDIAILLDRPVAGQEPVVVAVNDAFTRMTGSAAGPVQGRPLAALIADQNRTDGWDALVAAIAEARPHAAEVAFAGAARPFWFGFDLSTVPDPADGAPRTLLIGRDVTVARRRRLEQAQAEELLAAVFLRIGVPVAVIRVNGRFVATNPAFQHLLGYRADELRDINSRSLIAPEDVAEAARRHTEQLRTGVSFEMPIRLTRQDGSLLAVVMFSEVAEMRTAERLRVLTLLPERGSIPPHAIQTAVLGKLHTLSLAEIRQVFAERWSGVAQRAMLLAEGVVRRRISPRDAFVRSHDEDFIIWYATGTPEECAARTAAMAREIRARLLDEFDGEPTLGRTTAVTGVVDAHDTAGLPNPAALGDLGRRIDTQARALEEAARRTILTIGANPPVELARVVDRNGHPTLLAVIDVPHPVRARLAAALSAIVDEAPAGFDLDLLRLSMALEGLASDLRKGGTMRFIVPVSCDTLLSRRRREVYLDGLRNLAPGVRSRLISLVTDLPQDGSPQRLTDQLRLLRPLVRALAVEIEPTASLGSTLFDAQFSMLAIDARGQTITPDPACYTTIGEASRRGTHVIARLGDEAQRRDWCEMGADLLAIPPHLAMEPQPAPA
jgi:PAS domain S-box-containing protein